MFLNIISKSRAILNYDIVTTLYYLIASNAVTQIFLFTLTCSLSFFVPTTYNVAIKCPFQMSLLKQVDITALSDCCPL